MSIKFKRAIKSTYKEKFDDYKVPVGFIRLRLPDNNSKWEDDPNRLKILKNIQRGDYIKLYPNSESGKKLIRRVLGSNTMKKDHIIIDYDSFKYLGGDSINLTIEFKSIKRLLILGSLRFYLFSTPDLGLKVATWLGLFSFFISIVSLLLTIK